MVGETRAQENGWIEDSIRVLQEDSESQAETLHEIRQIMAEINRKHEQSVARLSNHFSDHGDTIGELTELKQISSVKAYEENFRELASTTKGLHEEFFTHCFVNGLKEEIKANVKMYHPKNLTQAIRLAKLQEVTIEVGAIDSHMMWETMNPRYDQRIQSFQKSQKEKSTPAAESQEDINQQSSKLKNSDCSRPLDLSVSEFEDFCLFSADSLLEFESVRDLSEEILVLNRVNSKPYSNMVDLETMEVGAVQWCRRMDKERSRKKPIFGDPCGDESKKLVNSNFTIRDGSCRKPTFGDVFSDEFKKFGKLGSLEGWVDGLVVADADGGKSSGIATADRISVMSGLMEVPVHCPSEEVWPSAPVHQESDQTNQSLLHKCTGIAEYKLYHRWKMRRGKCKATTHQVP